MITSDQLTTQKFKFQTVVLLSAGVGVQFPYRMILYWFSWYRGALNSIQDGLLQVFADKGIIQNDRTHQSYTLSKKISVIRDTVLVT